MTTNANLSSSNCCPDAPDITVYNTIIEIDGAAAGFKVESKVIGDSASSAGLVFTLGFTPVSNASVQVAVNKLVLEASDFTVSGTTVTLVTAIEAGDEVDFRYMAVL